MQLIYKQLLLQLSLCAAASLQQTVVGRVHGLGVHLHNNKLVAPMAGLAKHVEKLQDARVERGSAFQIEQKEEHGILWRLLPIERPQESAEGLHAPGQKLVLLRYHRVVVVEDDISSQHL